jgi:hypothetical protein
VRKLVALVALAACADEPIEPIDPIDDPIDDGGFNELVTDDKADGSEWADIGYGVAYRHVNAGTGILIAYGGYTARLVDSAAWATELVNEKLGANGIGHIYAVKGPADASYSAREIQNTKLRAHMAMLPIAPITVVAHSSGTYVAHELLGQLGNDSATLGRIAYANLDGGGSGLTTQIVSALRDIDFVYARDPVAGLSHNSGTARALAMAYGVAPIEVLVSMTGCASGASWCVHDVVITHRPHNPNSFDVANDYTDFVNRSVTTEYLP